MVDKIIEVNWYGAVKLKRRFDFGAPSNRAGIGNSNKGQVRHCGRNN
jgi:hypothetical protein